jgi:hypothetical protein
MRGIISTPGLPSFLKKIEDFSFFHLMIMKKDLTEFMVLALQRYDVYRESILGLARKKALGGEHIALVNPTFVST